MVPLNRQPLLRLDDQRLSCLPPPIYCHGYHSQARIQDFPQGEATAKRGLEIRGPRGQRPQVNPYQKPKGLRIWSTIF